jgi:hypothetical protein
LERRLIARKFWKNLGSLPGLNKVITFASIQGFGKWECRRQSLNKWVRWNNGRLGTCLRHSFGMPSFPQAFLNFKEFINICQRLLEGFLSTDYSRAGTLTATRRSWRRMLDEYSINAIFQDSINNFHKLTSSIVTVIYWHNLKCMF